MCIDESIDSFDGVCEDCGLVLNNGTDLGAVDWKISDQHRSQNDDESWLSFCTVRNATDQRLAHAFDSLEEFADQLDLDTKTRHEAADVYCDAYRTETTDGRKTECVVAACLRLATQKQGKPIPEGRLVELPNVSQKKFHLSHTALQKNLEFQPPAAQPSDYISFLTTALGLDEHGRRAVEKTLGDVADEPALVGKDPVGIAAAAVYLTQENYTQATLADTAGVSTETIRQRLKQLRKLANHD
ncbi:hypothetical protein ACLI4Y_13010 [Natrialbaceae archaeon A-CW3]